MCTKKICKNFTAYHTLSEGYNEGRLDGGDMWQPWERKVMYRIFRCEKENLLSPLGILKFQYEARGSSGTN